MFLRAKKGSSRETFHSSFRFLPTAIGVLLLGCGARSSPFEGREHGEAPECNLPEDCSQKDLCRPQTCDEGRCVQVTEVECKSLDPCERSSCDPATGACIAEALTLDLDGDGHRSPLVGFAPGAPGSCGDDCDDKSSLAFPGGEERCDGVDNDCDGVVDNGSNYLSNVTGELPEALPVAIGLDGSGEKGLAFGDGTFVLGYWGRSDLTVSYLRGLGVGGDEIFSQTPVSNVNAPSFGPDVVWTGANFAAIWSDPRIDDNYEIYFARFNVLGEKLGPDLRVTEAPDFSIHPRSLFDQGRFVVVWDDRRTEDIVGGSQIYAQFISESGELEGENRLLIDRLEIGESPAIAATPERYGVAYVSLNAEDVSLRFRTFDKELLSSSETLSLAPRGVRAPRVSAVGDVFVVSWDVYDVLPGESIMAAVVSQDGQLLTYPQPVTSGATFARSHFTISLGDRFVLLWSDDHDGNYELYAKVLTKNLSEVEARYRLTNDAADTLSPYAALGEFGRIGILFDDWRSGAHQAYFTTVGCGSTLSVR